MHETHIIPEGYTFTFSADVVRHDKRLSKGAKLLYLDIYQLSQTSGICTAGNEKLMDFLGESKRNIQRFIKELNQYGYITVRVKNINERIITIVPLGKQEKYRELYEQKETTKKNKQATNLSLMNDRIDAHERQDCRHNNISKYYKDNNMDILNFTIGTSVANSASAELATSGKNETTEKEIAETIIVDTASNVQLETNTSLSAYDNSVANSASAELATSGNTEMTDEELEELFSSFPEKSSNTDVQDSGVSPDSESSENFIFSPTLKASLFSDLDDLKFKLGATDIKMSSNYYGSGFITVADRRAKINAKLAEFDF